MAKILTEKHPLRIKYNKLLEFMDDLNITIEWTGYEMTIRDHDTNAYITVKGAPITEIPYIIETQLIKKE